MNEIPTSWDSFIQGICARRKLISFSRLCEDCTQKEVRLVTKEDKMGATVDQALTVHSRRNHRKKEDHHHNRSQKKFIKYPSNIRCYTCDEKGHYSRDCPKNKGSFNKKSNKKRHHAHTAEESKKKDLIPKVMRTMYFNPEGFNP